MPELPQKKVGIVACSGEEIAAGTVTRLAALQVLETLRPADTVTICLPLFLAGGEGDRAFARFYPTIAVDGCAQRCAARATEEYSGKPAASFVVDDLIAARGLPPPQGRRRLDDAGRQAAALLAEEIATTVDELLDRRWSRRRGEFVEEAASEQQPRVASCACGSGIPVLELVVGDETLSLVAVPALFAQWQAAGKQPAPSIGEELLAQAKIYNTLPAGADDEQVAASLLTAYTRFCAEEETTP